MCMTWTWCVHACPRHVHFDALVHRYLAIDMQLFVVAPVFILPLFFKPKLGVAINVIAIVCTAITCAAIAFEKDVCLDE